MDHVTRGRRGKRGPACLGAAALAAALAACGTSATAAPGPSEDASEPPSVETRREMDRYAGASRYETAVEISRHSFPDGAGVVYLARGDEAADALASGSLSDGPVLLVPSCDALPQVVIDELDRLDPARVVALGGPSAVCDAVLVEAAVPGALPPPGQGAVVAPPPPSDYVPQPGANGGSTPAPADFSVTIAGVTPAAGDSAGEAVAAEEHVELRNSGDATIELDGWYLLDSGDNYLAVSQDHVIEPGGAFRVHVGTGTDTPDRHYNGRAPMLDAAGDVLRLFRGNGDLIHEYRYP